MDEVAFATRARKIDRALTIASSIYELEEALVALQVRLINLLRQPWTPAVETEVYRINLASQPVTEVAAELTQELETVMR
jgi:hypothetical protein